MAAEPEQPQDLLAGDGGGSVFGKIFGGFCIPKSSEYESDDEDNSDSTPREIGVPIKDISATETTPTTPEEVEEKETEPVAEEDTKTEEEAATTETTEPESSETVEKEEEETTEEPEVKTRDLDLDEETEMEQKFKKSSSQASVLFFGLIALVIVFTSFMRTHDGTGPEMNVLKVLKKQQQEAVKSPIVAIKLNVEPPEEEVQVAAVDEEETASEEEETVAVEEKAEAAEVDDTEADEVEETVADEVVEEAEADEPGEEADGGGVAEPDTVDELLDQEGDGSAGEETEVTDDTPEEAMEDDEEATELDSAATAEEADPIDSSEEQGKPPQNTASKPTKWGLPPPGKVTQAEI